jgi:PadR family transcriptional regulator, regulatory protein PadR
MRMTRTTRAVLETFLADPASDHYGYELLKATGIKGGSVYPILERLESEGWIVGSWKESTAEGRPRRRCYRLTGIGLREAKIATRDPGALDIRTRPLGVL